MRCEQFYMNGKKTVKTHSYIAILCRKLTYEEMESPKAGPDDYMAVRVDYQERKEDVYKILSKEYPDWKMKGVWRLYDEDFGEEKR